MPKFGPIRLKSLWGPIYIWAFFDSRSRTKFTGKETEAKGSIGPNSTRTISLWRPFYSGGYETDQSRPFVLIHEETHRFTFRMQYQPEQGGGHHHKR
jgi:hypothetical protein